MSEPKIDLRSRLLRDSVRTIDDAASASAILLRFSDAVDGRLPAQVARLFAADGIFCPGDKQIFGRTSIEAFYTSRLSDPRRSTRHLWSNVQHRLTSDVEAQIEATLTVYAFEPQVSETHLQLRLGNVRCRCILDLEDGWVFSEHLYVRAFAVHLPLNLPIDSAQEKPLP